MCCAGAGVEDESLLPPAVITLIARGYGPCSQPETVLRSLPLPQKVAALPEAESGFNDAPTITLVLPLSTAAAGLPTFQRLAANVIYQLVTGGLLGLVNGRFGVAALRHFGLYPLTTVGSRIIA